jgi:hypothetical protein
MKNLTLSQIVLAIITRAEAIDNLGAFQQPAAAKKLLKDDVVPFLHAVAEKLDTVDLTQFNNRLDHNNKAIEALNKKITQLEAQVKKLTKPAATKAAE